jgi:hypothetical protein
MRNSTGKSWQLRRLVLLGAPAIILSLLEHQAQGQDWKPGDPIPFGAAHKSMFDSSTPAGAPGSSRVISPGTAAGALSVPAYQQPAASQTTQQSPMDNFLNSRTIEWKPGDPVSFGAAHRPPSNNKSLNGDYNQSLPGVSPSLQSATPPAIQPMSSPTGANAFPASVGSYNPAATIQDLSPNPATSGAATAAALPAIMSPGVVPGAGARAAVPGVAGFPGSAGQFGQPGTFSRDVAQKARNKKSKESKKSKEGKENKESKTSQESKVRKENKNNPNLQNMSGLPEKSGVDAGKSAANDSGSGNIFTHAFHWMGGLFGGNK